MNSPIPVYCRHHVLAPIAGVAEHPRNPNRHPIEQIETLATIIKKNGWRSPIVVSRRSGFIVKGHGRFEAAKRLAATVVPVEYQDYATEAEEYADMVADNRLSELSAIDNAALHSLLGDATAAGMELDAAGFTDAAFKELEKTVNGSSPEAVAESSAAAANTEVTVEKIVVGKYKVDVPALKANAWLRDLYTIYNNDEMLIISDVKKRLGLSQ